MGAPDEATFGELLKSYCETARPSQEELASRAGLSRHGISDTERGLGPVRAELGSAADALWAEGQARSVEEAVETALEPCSAST